MNDETGAWWKAEFGASYVVTKVKILNRGDCCGKRLDGTKIFIGENLCGTLNNPEEGKWAVVKCKVQGSFIKIQGAPKKYLHFCGLKLWAITGGETITNEVKETVTETVIEEDDQEPEPVK